MDWVKKNLFLVVGGVVALALLGLAGFFLYTKYTWESEVSANLQAQTEELDRLSRLKPHPGDRKVDNIKAAKDQDAELQEFAKQLRATFVPINYPTNLDSGQLKLLLDSTLDELQRTAQRTGVKTPANFGYGFSAQRNSVSFDQNSIKPLTFALEEIRALTKVLFNARVLTLDSIRRVSLGAADTGAMGMMAAVGPGDTWPKKPTTNDMAILTPYEITFHCFTPELANVLQGMAQSSHGFLVKNVQVDTVASSLLETNSLDSPTYQPPMGMGGGMNAAMAARYGIGRYGRPGMMAPPPEAAAPTGPTPTRRGGLNIMIEEKPFRVVLWVDVLRMIDPNEARSSKARSRATPAAEAPDGSATPETPAAETTN